MRCETVAIVHDAIFCTRGTSWPRKKHMQTMVSNSVVIMIDPVRRKRVASPCLRENSLTGIQGRGQGRSDVRRKLLSTFGLVCITMVQGPVIMHRD